MSKNSLETFPTNTELPGKNSTNDKFSDSASRRVLTLFDCCCIIVGTIIGSGIFKIPSLVATTVPDVFSMILVWVSGGLVALIGAMCFAELTTTYPDRGGDYGYLKRAFHPRVGFAFSWTAFWIVRPANIGAMAIIFGEFASSALPNWLSLFGFAVLSIVLVSATNLLGVVVGKTAQNILTIAKVLGILLIVASAFLFAPNETVDSPEGETVVQVLDGDIEAVQVDEMLAEGPRQADPGWFWLAMVFVMFSFGGWNDIAFVASEVQNPKVNLVRSLVIGVLTVIGIYLLVNCALLYGLGFGGMSDVGFTGNVTSELVQQNLGAIGNRLLSVVVCVSCLGAINAMIFTSPRIYSATAADYQSLSWLAGNEKQQAWWRAMLLQGVVTFVFVVVFGRSNDGFENLAVANAPFFWSFLGLTVFSLIVLRHRSQGEFEGFRSPFYPLLPIIFVAACGFMVYRSWIFMVQSELMVPTIAMAGWVAVGVGLSFILHRKQ
ncbi:MAG: amino acid permease [Mariniblastus sp.]|nr:amino acid permease [Mariniblastus sp.]